MRPTAYAPRKEGDSVHNTESGFSLVELAIALSVIGLLIAGFLKGNEVLYNSRINKTIRDLQAYETAIASFKDAYGFLPGDIPTPADVLPNCYAIGNCTSGGNGDGVVNGTEINVVWRTHLDRGGFMSETLKGGLIRSYTLSAGATGTIIHVGHILRAEELILPKALSLIDSKIDDGRHASGRIRPSTTASCTTGVEYNIHAQSEACTLAYLLQY